MTSTLERSDRPLDLARTVLRLLIKLNVILGILIFALLIATLIAGGPVTRALGLIPTPDSGRLFVLARVFDQGARMRDELTATV